MDKESPTTQVINATPAAGEQQVMTKKSCVLSFVVPFLALAAIIIGTGANIYCQSVQFTQEEGNDDLVLYSGTFSYKTSKNWVTVDPTFATNMCAPFSSLSAANNTNDAKTKTVVAFTVITVLFGVLVIWKSGFGALCGTNTANLKVTGGMFFFVAFLQGLTLLVYPSSSICNDNPAMQYLEATNPNLAATFPATCEISTAYVGNIVAVLLWIAGGVCSMMLPPPLVIREQPHQEQTVTYTQNADGTVQENHVTIVKGAPVQ